MGVRVEIGFDEELTKLRRIADLDCRQRGQTRGLILRICLRE